MSPSAEIPGPLLSGPPSRIPMIAVVGGAAGPRSRLVAHLVTALSAAGLAVGVVKHREDATIDRPDSDSDRLRRAGAVAVGLVAKDEVGLYRSRVSAADEAWIATTLASLPSPPDVLVGDSCRHADHAPVAIISEELFVADVPVFHPALIDTVVDLVVERLRSR